MGLVEVAAVEVLDAAGRLLVVRKAGTDRFMLVGGKAEPGETWPEVAAREVAEEVGLVAAASDYDLVGVFEAPAANEPGWLVRGHTFRHRGVAPEGLVARAEIAEMRWIDPADAVFDDACAGGPVPAGWAPLLVRHTIPGLRAQASGRHPDW